jgi:hypothetical protein
LNARRFRSFTTNGIAVHFQFTSKPFQARKHVIPKDTEAKEKKEVEIESANRRQPVVKLKTRKKQKTQNNENDNEKLQKEKEKKKRKNDGRNEDAADKRARHDNESADAPPPETKIYVPGPPEFLPQDKSSKRESVCRPPHTPDPATNEELLHATMQKQMEEFLPSAFFVDGVPPHSLAVFREPTYRPLELKLEKCFWSIFCPSSTQLQVSQAADATATVSTGQVETSRRRSKTFEFISQARHLAEFKKFAGADGHRGVTLSLLYAWFHHRHHLWRYSNLRVVDDVTVVHLFRSQAKSKHHYAEEKKPKQEKQAEQKKQKTVALQASVIHDVSSISISRSIFEFCIARLSGRWKLTMCRWAYNIYICVCRCFLVIPQQLFLSAVNFTRPRMALCPSKLSGLIPDNDLR